MDMQLLKTVPVEHSEETPIEVLRLHDELVIKRDSDWLFLTHTEAQALASALLDATCKKVRKPITHARD